MSDPSLYPRAWALLESAGQAALNAREPEKAIEILTQACFGLLGDRERHLQPGALKGQERQFFVAGVFIVTPDRQHHMLVGNVGFPPEQKRLMVPIDGGHPGHVYASGEKLILKNTDDHGSFKQYLKSARMGSAVLSPMIWQGQFLGQLFMAAQARHTFDDPDLEVLVAFSRLATAVWVALDGPAWTQAHAQPEDAFYVAREGLPSA